MAKHRQGRINDEFQKEVAMILREVKDPRVSGAFVSVTAAEVTPDLKYAKVYYYGSFRKKFGKENCPIFHFFIDT